MPATPRAPDDREAMRQSAKRYSATDMQWPWQAPVRGRELQALLEDAFMAGADAAARQLAAER